MTKPSKAHMAAAKHLLRYLAGMIDFSITYKKDDSKLTAFSDANWGNNPSNGKSTSSYIIMLSKAPVSFKVGLQSMTAVTGSRMNCNVTTVEGLPSSTGLNSS